MIPTVCLSVGRGKSEIVNGEGEKNMELLLNIPAHVLNGENES